VQWGIQQGAFNDSVDLSAFKQWHKKYLAALKKNNWIDQVQLLTVVCELVKESSIACPSHIVLAGFDVLTPSQKTLCEMLESKGCEIVEFEPYGSNGHTQVLTTVDVKQEMSLMAQWARERIDASPSIKIGIVVPELETVRQQLEVAFSTAFYPSITYATDLPFNKPYNVSLGLPLTNFAPLQQVLRLLSFFNKPLPLNELSMLLRSPFITAGQAEWGERARVEVSLLKKGYLACSIHQLERELQPTEGKRPLCGQLQLSLKEVIGLLDKKPNRVLPSEWVEIFRLLLTAVSVQGDQDLSSTEYQVFQAWDNVLHTFAKLDAVTGVIDYAAAVGSLRRLLAERVFQPETPPAPIQIMGIMEAAGHTFDALWVCGLHDKCWPPAPQPSPFLPIIEQRKQGLIQSSAELQHQHASKVTKNWARSASEVMFSYSSFDAETPRQMSPLLEPYPLIDKDSLLKQQPIDRVSQRIGGEQLEALEDNNGPLLRAEGVTRGGVGVLKDQSACPFKAFAHYRLQASALEEPEPGIDARLRGSLVHSALESVWSTLKTHQGLCDLTEGERRQLVEDVASQVVKHESKHTPILKTAFGRLEAQRITELLLDWLLIDSEREPFEVAQTELKQTLSVGQLQLNTSIDRVDTLQDGSTAIIDYKTGSTNVGSWFGDRPEEPQLPLYSVFGSEGVHSISFAQLKKGNVKYVGVSDTTEAFSSLKELGETKADKAEWDAQMAHWREVLSGLSDEFVAGDARVSPTKKACDYCDLTSLCRINEHTIASAGDE
jgi:probable DNA repair protein